MHWILCLWIMAAISCVGASAVNVEEAVSKRGMGSGVSRGSVVIVSLSQRTSHPPWQLTDPDLLQYQRPDTDDACSQRGTPGFYAKTARVTSTAFVGVYVQITAEWPPGYDGVLYGYVHQHEFDPGSPGGCSQVGDDLGGSTEFSRITMWIPPGGFVDVVMTSYTAGVLPGFQGPTLVFTVLSPGSDLPLTPTQVTLPPMGGGGQPQLHLAGQTDPSAKNSLHYIRSPLLTGPAFERGPWFYHVERYQGSQNTQAPLMFVWEGPSRIGHMYLFSRFNRADPLSTLLAMSTGTGRLSYRPSLRDWSVDLVLVAPLRNQMFPASTLQVGYGSDCLSLDGTRTVKITSLALLLANWGTCPVESATLMPERT